MLVQPNRIKKSVDITVARHEVYHNPITLRSNATLGYPSYE